MTKVSYGPTVFTYHPNNDVKAPQRTRERLLQPQKIRHWTYPNPLTDTSRKGIMLNLC